MISVVVMMVVMIVVEACKHLLTTWLKVVVLVINLGSRSDWMVVVMNTS